MVHRPNLAHAAIAAMMLHVAVPGMAQDNAWPADPPPPPAPVAVRPAPRPPAPSPTPPVRGPRISPHNVTELSARILETYPVRAKREGREGLVSVTVTVTPEGRVDACKVTQSSGHVDLDQAACAGMQCYARFNPALGSDGRPTAASYSTRITYRLP